MRLSLRTFGMAVAGFGSIAFYRTALVLNAGSDDAFLAVSDFGEAGIVLIVAACALVFALGMPSTVPAQKAPWILVALGILSFGVGDAVWAHQEVLMGIDPYPGLADVFYVLQYVLLGGALAVAGMRAGSQADRAAAAGFSLSIGAFALVLLWVLLLEPHVLGADIESLPELFLGLFYPIADILLLFVPALFVTLVVSRLGGGQWAWAWLFVAAGALVLAGSDSAFAWLDALDEYSAGNLVDYGWILSNVLLAVGVSIARDLAEPVRSILTFVHDEDEDDSGDALGARAEGA